MCRGKYARPDVKIVLSLYLRKNESFFELYKVINYGRRVIKSNKAPDCLLHLYNVQQLFN